MIGRDRGNWLRWFVLGLVAFFCACDKQDADRLARMGRRGASKVQHLTSDAQSKLSSRFQSMQSNMNEAALDSRVAARLRWDKMLAETQIEVTSPGRGVVELKGTIKSEDQRVRALGLARSTAGVDRAIDGMTRKMP